jgi:acetylornithine deacetylase
MGSEENTITASFAVVKALQELAAELNAEARSHALFKDTVNPIKFNPGMIRGGDWASSTPAWCDLDCRLGILPGESVDRIKHRVTDAVAAAARSSALLTRSPPQISWNGFEADGSALSPGSAAERVLSECHEQIFGTPVKSVLSNAVNDTRYYNHTFKIPALCYGPAGEGLHSINERANLPNLKKTTLVLALFVATWCGVSAN